jgi:hypothetical protein
MISPIDNLMKMFFKWKLDILANITLASIAQCMKFKLLYDDWIRIYPLKQSTQPVITLYNILNNNKNNNNNNNKNNKNKNNKNKNNNNKNKNNNNQNSLEINEYGDDIDVSEEEDKGISIDFITTFSKYFDNNELRN